MLYSSGQPPVNQPDCLVLPAARRAARQATHTQPVAGADLTWKFGVGFEVDICVSQL